MTKAAAKFDRDYRTRYAIVHGHRIPWLHACYVKGDVYEEPLVDLRGVDIDIFVDDINTVRKVVLVRYEEDEDSLSIFCARSVEFAALAGSLYLKLGQERQDLKHV